MIDVSRIKHICGLLRYDILNSTTAAKSGHPTSSLSAVELMATLFFGGFLSQDTNDFKRIENDRVIFSKGHAAPLLYALYHVAGVLKYEELLTLRKFGSRLQGHSTPDLPFVDVATGSLGQGLSIGVGMALGMRLISNKQIPRVFVLVGDSELAEGQNWEAAQIASYYKLNNLVAIVDVNRLGQRGETMLEWDLKTYEKRFKAFGWNTIIVKDGHDISEIIKAFNYVFKRQTTDDRRPTAIIAKTIKGKGVSFLEDKPGWHGKPVSKEQLEEALHELGSIDLSLKGKIKSPQFNLPVSPITQSSSPHPLTPIPYTLTSLYSTREAFGDALLDLGSENNKVVALDAEVGNSTYSEKFGKRFPERFFQCYIEEQHMASAALGLAKIGFIPYISSFAAFLTRAFDQIRMAQYSLSTNTTINIVSSHCGVSIGEDGASQMGLEDIAMMRSIRESTVLYPSDAVSVYKLTKAMATHPGINYLRTTREKTPVIYNEKEEFPIGGLKVHNFPISNDQYPISKQRTNPKFQTKAVIIAAGITLHVALKAQEILAGKGIFVTVVDLYSVKPIDVDTLKKLVNKTSHVIVAEDHYECGGMGEAVLSALTKPQTLNPKSQSNFKFTHLCVRKLPCSGTPQELLHFEHLDEESMVEAIMKVD